MPKLFYWKWLVISCFLVSYVQANEATHDTHSTLVQVSTIQALLKGVYDGDTTIGQLKTVGNFGLGTFDSLDGEMVVVDGRFYQVKADGTVHLVNDTMLTPFATVHFFQNKKEVTLKESIKNYQQLQLALDHFLSSRNRPYAFKITGRFDYIKTRSVSKQTKPYSLSPTIIAHQSEFEFDKIQGVLVGYWLPDYMDKLNVPGYHLHFLSEDKQHGGHLLDCRLSEVVVTVDYLDQVNLWIPQHPGFQQADLSTYNREELEKVEKGQNSGMTTK